MILMWRCFAQKVRAGKAFSAEQKIREIKRKLLRSKRFEKLRKNGINLTI